MRADPGSHVGPDSRVSRTAARERPGAEPGPGTRGLELATLGRVEDLDRPPSMNRNRAMTRAATASPHHHPRAFSPEATREMIASRPAAAVRMLFCRRALLPAASRPGTSRQRGTEGRPRRLRPAPVRTSTHRDRSGHQGVDRTEGDIRGRADKREAHYTKRDAFDLRLGRPSAPPGTATPGRPRRSRRRRIQPEAHQRRASHYGRNHDGHAAEQEIPPDRKGAEPDRHRYGALAIVRLRSHDAA